MLCRNVLRKLKLMSHFVRFCLHHQKLIDIFVLEIPSYSTLSDFNIFQIYFKYISGIKKLLLNKT